MPQASLVEYWQRASLAEAPYIHPDDRDFLKRYRAQDVEDRAYDFSSFISSDSFGIADSRLHFSLLPAPYLGDLDTADIFVLLLNPGFEDGDYYCEYKCPEWREALINTLQQDLKPREFPNICLDPDFCWTGAYRWWTKKLDKVIRCRAKNYNHKNGGYLSALREISQRLAVIEMVPYHSRSFRGTRLIRQLASAQAARRYAKGELASRAEAGEITVVVTRSATTWKLEDNGGNLVVYSGGLARSATLGSASRGGSAILRQLRRRDPLPR